MSIGNDLMEVPVELSPAARRILDKAYAARSIEEIDEAAAEFREYAKDEPPDAMEIRRAWEPIEMTRSALVLMGNKWPENDPSS